MNRLRYAHFTLAVLAVMSLFLFGPTTVYSQDQDGSKAASLSGFVRDSATKETIVSATITIKGTKLGTLTNKSGYYSLRNIPPGKRTVVVSILGHNKQTHEITFEPGATVKRTFTLSEQSVKSQEVVIEARADEEERREISISRIDVPLETVKQLRVAGESDVFRTLQLLPGVLTSSQISAGLFIRGGSPDQNLVLLDGSTVYNPSHLFGFISAFNPDAIKDVELIKGGYPAEFGSRLSSVLNLTQKDGNKENFEGVASLGLISSRLSLQGPVANGSWFLGGRRTYLEALLSIIPEDPLNPFPDFNFYDLNGKISQNFGPDNKVFASGFLSSDNLRIVSPGIDFGLGISNRTASIRWDNVMSDNLFGVVNLAFSRYGNAFDGNNAGFTFKAENFIQDYTVKTDLEWFASEQLTVKGGYEGTMYTFGFLQAFGTDSLPAPGTTQGGATNLRVNDFTHSLFSQVNYQVSDLLSLQAGLRFNYWDSSTYATWDPRVSVRYQLQEDVVIKAAWGLYHQYFRLASLPDFTFFDTWLPTDRTVPASQAYHYILSFETKPFENTAFNVDFYYKDLNNISELRQTATQSENVAQIFFNGRGRAYGMELFLQRKVGDITGWVGYAYGMVESQFAEINFGRWFNPRYDRRHDFKVVALYSLSDSWEFGASFTFQSGQPYTAATHRFGTFLPGETDAISYIVPAERFGLRMPNSHQLNVNLNYNTTFFDLPAKLLIDVYNVYSRRDYWFIFYNTNGPVAEVREIRLLPILPTIAFEVNF